MIKTILQKFMFLVLFISNPYSINIINGQVKIGEQIWMTSNLNTSKFQNGDPIYEAKTKAQWIKASEEGKPAWCYFQNNPQNGVIYGKLYNWYAVNDPRGIAPKGWHIPTNNEWNELISFLEKDIRDVNKALKTKIGWKQYETGGKEEGSDCGYCNGTGKLWSRISYKYKLCVFCGGTGGDKRYVKKRILSGNGTNTSGFSAKPGADRFDNGDFSKGLGEFAMWWSDNKTNHDGGNENGIYIDNDYYAPKIGSYEKGYGFSVRLIKDKSKELLERERIRIEEEKKKNQIYIQNFEILDQRFELKSFFDAVNFVNKLGEGWRLPSKEELNIIFENKTKNEKISKLVSYASSSYFWSSSQSNNPDNAIVQDFNGGLQFGSDKYSRYNIIAIRDIR